MSLIAWYPLNGDTRDYSGNNLHLTNNGATINTSGKIGSCYEFDKELNANMTCQNLNCSNMQNEFTVSVWFKSTQSHEFATIVSLGQSAITIDCQNGTYIRAFIYLKATGSVIILNSPCLKDKWTHITYKLENEYLYLYVNGVLKSKTAAKGIPRINNTDSIYLGTRDYNNPNYFQGCLNDVRIYNEALSAKQIKEISQAKICHYTFNEELYENTTNLYANYPELSGMVTTDNNDYTIDKVKLNNGHYRYKIYKKVTKNSWPNIQFPAYKFTPGKNYTISVDIKMIEKRNKATVEIRHSAINNDYGTPGRKNVSITNSPLGEWKRYTLTRSFDETTSLNGTTYDVSPRMEIYTTMANEGDYLEFEVRNYQVEEKDHATPFTPNSRTQTLKDISGYNHDMKSSLEVSPVWKNDEQKSYVRLAEKAHYYFNDLNIVNLKEFTYSCWIRTSDDQSYNLLGSPTENNSNHSMAIIGGKICFHTFFHTPDANADKNYAVSKTIITDNQWHLATITYDDSIVKTYIDGKLENQSNLTMNFDTYKGNKIGLNLWNMNDMGDYETRRFSGDITDVRIYATALSAEDIKLLYQPEISIDKSNIVRCSEINEKEMTYPESIEIVSRGYGANQNTYKVSIGDRYTTTEKETGWGVTVIDIDNNITHKTFRTHGSYVLFKDLKSYVESIPATSTILLSTFDQPSAGEGAGSNENCMAWINYLRGIGATQIDGTLVYRASYAAIIQENKIIAEVVDNSGNDSNATLNTVVNLKLNKKGFNKNASIAYNEFNEVPNVESGVHNLKLGNEILPVLIDMDNNEGRWARVFYHNCKSGKVLFSGQNSFAEAKETNINAPTTSDKYSILSKLESFRPNTNSPFEFRIKYPTDTDSGLNKWAMKHYDNVTLASAETYPLLSDIKNLAPTTETIVEDTNSFIPNIIEDHFIRHYKTKVYSNIAKNIYFQIKSDDGVTCYINNSIAFQKKTTVFSDVKISLNKGWNTLEFLYYENVGQNYLVLNQKISELVDILDYNGTYNNSNIWKQTSNPTYEKIAGYTPIKINWTSSYWGGLEWNGSTTLIDGSVNHSNWYYAIGTNTKHGDGIPSFAEMKNTSTSNDVELWVRINNYDLFANNLIENVSISRDGILTAKEFREIY